MERRTKSHFVLYGLMVDAKSKEKFNMLKAKKAISSKTMADSLRLLFDTILMECNERFHNGGTGELKVLNALAEVNASVVLAHKNARNTPEPKKNLSDEGLDGEKAPGGASSGPDSFVNLDSIND